MTKRRNLAANAVIVAALIGGGLRIADAALSVSIGASLDEVSRRSAACSQFMSSDVIGAGDLAYCLRSDVAHIVAARRFETMRAESGAERLETLRHVIMRAVERGAVIEPLDEARRAAIVTPRIRMTSTNDGVVVEISGRAPQGDASTRSYRIDDTLAPAFTEIAEICGSSRICAVFLAGSVNGRPIIDVRPAAVEFAVRTAMDQRLSDLAVSRQ